MNLFADEKKRALCLVEHGADISTLKIQEFTKDINLIGYLVCSHKKAYFAVSA